MNIGTLWVTIGADVTGLNNATKSLNTTAQRFRTFGYLATAAVTMPMVMAGKAAMKMASSYEFSMQKIVGLTGVAQKAVNAWSAEILAVAPKLARGPQELADALYFISSSGIKGARAMEVLKVSAKAATAGLGQTEDIANLLTSVLNAYAGTGMTAAYATDILVAAVREGKAEADQFATSIGSVIPYAAQLGVSFDQVAGAMAAMTLSGASAANSATYLRNFLMKLIKPAKQSIDQIEALGSSFGELRKSLAEKGLMPTLEKVRGLTEKYGIETLGNIFPNIRALMLYLSLAGKNMKYNSELMERVTNSTGTLGEAFAAVAKTIKVRYDVAISSSKVALISLGKTVAETFLPILESLIKKLEKLTVWFNDLSDAEKHNKLVQLAWIAAAGPLSMAFSLIIYSISGLVAVMKVAITASRLLFTTVITGGPWGILVTVLGLAAVGLIRYQRKVEDTIRANDSFYTSLVDVNGELKKLKDLTEVDFAQMNFMQLQSHLNWATNAVKQQLDRVKYYYAEAGVSAKDYEKAIAIQAKGPPAVKGTALWKEWKWAERMLTVHGQYAATIENENKKLGVYKQQVEGAQSAIDSFIDSSGRAVGVIKEVTDGIEEETNAMKKAFKVLENYNETLKEQNKELDRIEKNRIKGGVSTDYEKLFKRTGAIGFGATTDITPLQKFQTELDLITLKNRTLGESFNTTQAQMSFFKTTLNNLWDAGMRPGMPLMDTMIEKMKELSAQQEIVNRLTDAFTDFFMITKEGFQNFREYVNNWALSILRSFQQLIAQIVAKGIVEAIFPAVKIAETAVSTAIATTATTALTGATVAKTAAEAASIPVTTAETIAAGQLAVALAAASAAWIPFPGNLAAMASAIGTVVAGIATGSAAIAGMNLIPGLAEGAVIPPGYPNDSYPARLTSGEIVTPPKALGSLQPALIEVTVKGVQRGEDIYYIVEEIKRKRKNSF